MSTLILDEPRYEIVDGEEVEQLPMSAFESEISSRLMREMGNAADKQNCGRAVMEMLFRFAPNRPQRRSDTAYVSFKRWPKNRSAPRQNAWAVIPEFVAEIVSPSDIADTVIDRVNEYFGSGVSMVWVVWPTVKQVYIYSSPTQVRIIGADGILDAEPLLPGWRWPVAELFGPDEDESAEPAESGEHS